MRLIEAILKANQAAAAGNPEPLSLGEFKDSLPLAAVTCIDARLNRLLPERLGVPDEQFVWLRNAGNIITGPLSSTMRSLALACAVKGAREIVVIGHTDCQVCKSTMLKLTESLRALGVDRHRLPENLVEYFGLFASERQNVMRGVDIIRSSPLIGSKVPVHGLLLDVATGRLESVVNGYETTASVASAFTSALNRAEATVMDVVSSLPDTTVGEPKDSEARIGGVHLPQVQLGGVKLPEVQITGIKLPEIHIGNATIDPNQWLSQVKPAEQLKAERPVETAATAGHATPESVFDKARRYKIIGSDQKIYGPINGMKILQWIAEGRIGWDTPSQVEGSSEWRPLNLWAEVLRRMHVPLPPRLPGTRQNREDRKGGR